MLEATTPIDPESFARARADDLLICLASLLVQQDKLLEHPLSSADLYLYDWRAQQIRDLMVALDGNERTEARKSVFAIDLVRESPAFETVDKKLKQHERQRRLLPNYLAELVIPAWAMISSVLLKIRNLLSIPLFGRRSPAELLPKR
jgi:hypothetical protein